MRKIKFKSIHIDLEKDIYKINGQDVNKDRIIKLYLNFEGGRYRLITNKTDELGNELSYEISNFD